MCLKIWLREGGARSLVLTTIEILGQEDVESDESLGDLDMARHLGMRNHLVPSLYKSPHSREHAVPIRNGRVLKRAAVRYRHIGSCHPDYRSVHIIERLR